MEFDRERFAKFYDGLAPWDIPGPQPAMQELEEAGAIGHTVLDVGCGTGEHAMYLAERGHQVMGVDFVPVAIERAQKKASERGSKAQFQVVDALELGRLGMTFDTVIDCGLFHVFTDDQRPAFVESLAQVLKPGGNYHMLCFSDAEPPGEGPRRVTKREIYDTFHGGWQVREIVPTAFKVNATPETAQMSPGGPKGWRVTIVREP